MTRQASPSAATSVQEVRQADTQNRKRIRVALVGFGKMGASHHAIINAHPMIEMAAICDSAGYVLSVMQKYTGVRGFSDFGRMIKDVPLDAIVIATPSRLHAQMVEAALEAGLHVFCEKPFCLDASESLRLAELAAAKALVNQVGYHYRFVGTFREFKRLLDLGAIGAVSHVLAEAYGPVVLKETAGTWRSKRSEGGGCLYDYAAHPINLLNWYFGPAVAVSGSSVKKMFSRDTEDEVYSTLRFGSDVTAQLLVNWCDESHRKMSVKLTAWGTNGRISADRQECQVYLRDPSAAGTGYQEGWNVRYTTDLTEPVWFYLRGEEYSAQIDSFVRAVAASTATGENDFASAAETDMAIAMILDDASRDRGVGPRPRRAAPTAKTAKQGLLTRLIRK